MLQGLVRGPLYQPVLASALPQAVAEARAGRWQGLVGLALADSGGGRRAGRIALGMHFGVVCAEDAPDPQQPPPTGPALARPSALYRAACAGWPPATLPADFGRLVPATQAVLLLSGAADPVTPPRHAQRVAAALGPWARHRVLAESGHGSFTLACVRDLVFRFVDAPDHSAALQAEADAGDCGQHLPRPPFFQPPAGVSAP
jgi:pimeloyl-ACP methyl ester carboxylesterase